MNIVLRQGMILLSAVAFLQCGGGRQVSQDEPVGGSSQDRIIKLEKQSAKKTNDITLKKQLYREYLGIGMTAKALMTMEDILIIDPNQTDVQFEYGEVQYQNGNYRKAYDAFLNVMQSTQGEAYRSRVAAYVSGGFTVQRVTSSSAAEGFPSFSPDGRKLLFQKKSGTNWDIVEYDLSTQSEATIIATPADEESPVYSPNGELITYTSTNEDARPVDPNYKVREILQIDKTDNFVRKLTQSVADDWLPRYSHSGEYLLFVSERNDLRKVYYVAKQSDLFVMESDGDFQVQLTNTPANEGGACFSADDKRIFFHSDQNGTFDIFSMKRDGSQIMTLIDDDAGNDVNPCTSPDGNWIAFVSDRDGNYEIYRARTNGSGEERLTFHPGVDSNPAFSPDGSMIAFHSNRNGNYDIYVINLSAPTAVLNSAELVSRLRELSQN